MKLVTALHDKQKKYKNSKHDIIVILLINTSLFVMHNLTITSQ